MTTPWTPGRRLTREETRQIPPAPHEVDDLDLDADELYDRDLADEEAGCHDPQCVGC